MILQLTDLIPMVTPLGKGYAILIDAREHDNYWTVALEDGAIVTFTQDRIRIGNSYTHHRGIDDEKMKIIITNLNKGNGKSNACNVRKNRK